MSNQGSLRGSEPIVSGVSVLVLGGTPGLATVPRHDENQGGREIVVGKDTKDAQEASKEARRAEQHCAEEEACK
jgi:hypothetical protein